MDALIDTGGISALLENSCRSDRQTVRDILSKASSLGGLNEAEVAILMNVEDAGLIDEVFDTARRIKEEIYGKRLVIFAPMYISNLCSNECIYCAFRRDNREIKRRYLSQEEIAEETRALLEQGHKRILVVAGESYPEEGFKYVLKDRKSVV
jgi:2-iminoacetate synthase